MSWALTSTVASFSLPSCFVSKARMATRSPGRSASTKARAARRMSPTSSRVEPEVSKSSATSKGASVVEKLAIFCGRPSSKTWKSEAVRPVRGRPVRSVTTAGTETSCVSTRTTSPSSTSWPAPSAPFAGDCLAAGVGVAAGCATALRGRWCVSSCARPPDAATKATRRTNEGSAKAFTLAGNFCTVLHSR